MSLSRAEDPEGAENEDCHYLAQRTQRILYQWWPIDVWVNARCAVARARRYFAMSIIHC
jgi:hypothetical protein